MLTFWNGLKRWSTRHATVKRSAATAPRRRLGLEALEERLVPAVNIIVEPAPTAAVAYRNVTGSLFASTGPSYLDVRQGYEGDCWLLASLAEVAARNPSDIKSMFTYTGTNAGIASYTVRFFNNKGVAQYVSVSSELPGGGTYYDRPLNGVLWPALAEKAYAKANAAGIVMSGNPGVDSYDALNYGDPTWALHGITGKSISYDSSSPNNVAADWNAGKLIVLGTSTPASYYVLPNHAYAVVGYDAKSAQPFELYNPWGTSNKFVSPGPNSSGWLYSGLYNGLPVYGLVNGNATFLTNNFSSKFSGLGSSVVTSAVSDEAKREVSVLWASNALTPTLGASGSPVAGPSNVAVAALSRSVAPDDVQPAPVPFVVAKVNSTSLQPVDLLFTLNQSVPLFSL